MSYLSLARKYRPQVFGEIVGQGHVATTLTNAILMDRVAHAYLFAGPRGVGKTSCARILAKSLNCEKGPTAKPCLTCPSCMEIARGSGMDVIEIDGASNRGIDEIRSLRENTKFVSLRGKFRVYIIDEVHMLTPEAFNALLKTLEEPPPHVKFIFATTMSYKVPPTIVSRCQRFDFRKISVKEITEKLKEIREKESLAMTDEAAFLIAKSADGSLRDAEVVLDQLLSFAKGKVEASDAVKVLGLLEQGILFEIADSMLNNEKGKLLKLINALTGSGKDPIFITTSIIGHFRDILMVKAIKDGASSYMAVSEENYKRLEEQGEKLSIDEILYINYTLFAAIDLMKKTNLSQIPLEISLIKLVERDKLGSIKEALGRLTDLEKKLAEGDFREEEAPRKLEKVEEIQEPTRVPKIEIAAERDILLLQEIKNSWGKILNFIKSKKMSLGTFLAEGLLLKVKDNVLAVGFNENNSLHKDTLEENTNKKFVEEAIKNILGESVFLDIKTVEGEEAGPPLVPNGEESGPGEGEDRRANAIDPIVESAMEIFDGKVVGVKAAEKAEKT